MTGTRLNPSDSVGDPVRGARVCDASRWKVIGCLALLVIGVYVVASPKLRLAEWRVGPLPPGSLREAIQWKAGSLAIPPPYYEIAEFEGRHYNVVNLAFTMMCFVGTTINEWLGGSPEEFPAFLLVAFLAVPAPFAAFWAFRSIGGSPTWAAVLAAYLILATGLYPALAGCRMGSTAAHPPAVVGLLMIGATVLGGKRLWLAGLGLCLAVWSRQMTCFYALPVLWVAWRSIGRRRSEGRAASVEVRWRRGEAIIAALLVLLAAAVPITLNTLKFGNPLDSGYAYIYEGRTDAIGRAAHEAVFGARYVPMHLRAMNLSFPALDVRGGGLILIPTDVDGASIWLTSPLLIGVLLTARRWWADPRRRAMMLASFAVAAGLMCYHTTGAKDTGYYRYALDFIPIWLLVIAPYTTGPRAAPWVLACLAYGALYNTLIP